MKYLFILLFLTTTVNAQSIVGSYSPDIYSVGYEVGFNKNFSTTTFINQHRDFGSSLSNRFTAYPVNLNISKFTISPYAGANIGIVWDYSQKENFSIGYSAGIQFRYKGIAIAPEFNHLHSDNRLYSGQYWSISFKVD